jgi:Divergent InlB B-repeat domain
MAPMNYKPLLLAATSSLCILAAPAQDMGISDRLVNRDLPPGSNPLTNTITTSVFPAGSGTATGGGAKAAGKSFTLTATPSAALKDVLVYWTVNDVVVSTTTPYTFTPTPNTLTPSSGETVTANFGFDITTTSSPATGGTNIGAGVYLIGQSITLVAVASPCYNFLGWTKPGSKIYQSTDAIYNFTPPNSEALVANYEIKEDVITTASYPVGAGKTAGGGTKTCGEAVKLTATATAGYKLSGWMSNGVPVGLANPSFEASGAATFTATFEDISTPTLTITSPKASATVSNTFLTITGTANNILSVSSVIVTVDGVIVPAISTNNWSNWTASVTLSLGANKISAYALSENFNPSKTNNFTVTDSAPGYAPASIADLLAQVSPETNTPYTVSFGSATFELFSADTHPGSSVGNYTYTVTGADTATLVLNTFGPPNQVQQTPTSISLTFISPITAIFTNQQGDSCSVTLSVASSHDFNSLAHTTLSLAALPTSLDFSFIDFGDGVFTYEDLVGSGTYTSMQYGPEATMVVLTNGDLGTGSISTNYLMLFWTNGAYGAAYETTYDAAGDPPTFSVLFFLSTQPINLTNKENYVAPASLNGYGAVVTQIKPPSSRSFTVSFGQDTMAQTSDNTNNQSQVSNYTYTRTSTSNATLIINNYLPPGGNGNTNNSDTIYLTFTSATKATYYNPADPSTGEIALTPILSTGDFAPAALNEGTLTFHPTVANEGGTATLTNGNFTINSTSGKTSTGTYTYMQYSPLAGLIIFTHTDAASAGEISYFQLTFNSAGGGSVAGDAYDTDSDGSITLGTFTLTH